MSESEMVVKEPDSPSYQMLNSQSEYDYQVEEY